eukprot:TRINITY_DN3936_c0_g1_i1.p1 TRINITY_DN3936_c0_g1~~TRINITY_DN3936_c0_g1_i1.p1  ORF type:complete len:335 (-),score=69.72 TRINITY_DN3936_c0_g1_i1:33-1037(-)
MSEIPTPAWGFLVDQFTPVPLHWRDLTGKIVVITGGNVGLGYEAAKHISTMYPEKLIIACRDPKKGQKAVEGIKAHSGFENVEVWEFDLSSFANVSSFVKRYQESGLRLDILISNAACAPDTWNFTEDGFEICLQVNHLSNMLLVLGLIPVMDRTAKEHKTEPRIVVVSSEVHGYTTYPQGKESDPIAALNDKSRSDIQDRYQVSKLLNVYMARKIASLIKSPIAIHLLNPGLCRTELSRDATGMKKRIIETLKFLVGRTAEQGARTLVHAAVHEELSLSSGPNGRFWSLCSENAPVLRGVDKKLTQTVWDESFEILQKRAPKIIGQALPFLKV